MKNIVFAFLFISIAIHAQQIEKPVEFKDSLFSASLFKKIKLSESFSLKPGLTLRRKTVFNTIETPILLNYESSEDLSLFFGVGSRTVINRTEFGEMVPYIEEPSKIFISTGSEFKFNNDTKGHFSINFPFELNMGLKF